MDVYLKRKTIHHQEKGIPIMVCSNCQAQNLEGSLFCSTCGVQQVETLVTHVNHPVFANTPSLSTSTLKTGLRKKRGAISMLVVLIIVLLSVGGYFLSHSISPSSVSSTQSGYDGSIGMGPQPTDASSNSNSASTSSQSSSNDPASMAQAFCTALVQKDYTKAASLYIYVQGYGNPMTAHDLEMNLYNDIMVNNGGVTINFPPGQTMITNCQITGSPVIAQMGTEQQASVYTTWNLVDGSSYQGNIMLTNWSGTWGISGYTIK